MKKWTQNWTTPLRLLLAGAGISAAAFMAPIVMSAQPPAGYAIRNQATATYVDTSGQAQSALSNLVSTTVAHVAGVDLVTSNEKSALPGQTVYMPHTLVNNGNGADSFTVQVLPSTPGSSKYSNVAIYPDANGTGVASSNTPLCSDNGTPACSAGFIQALDVGARFNFVVAYTVPVTANLGVVDTTTVKATSLLTSTVTDSETDKVTVVNGPVFVANKAVEVPSVAAPTGTTWPAAVSVGVPSAASCSATQPVWGPSMPAGCNYTTYTVGFKNLGNAPGTFTMQDPLPSGLTYVKGSAIWSGAGGTALSDGPTGAVTATNVTSSYDAGVLKVSVANVGPNVSGSISFVVLINNTATPDNGSASTTNLAKYWSVGCDPTLPASPTNCGTGTTPNGVPPVSTNPATVPVATVYGVIAAANNGAGNTPDNGIPAKADANLVSVPTAQRGARVPFTDYVINNGNKTDTFNVTVPAVGTANNNYPTGTTFAFFKEDGVTPLTDTNNDGIVDTGPLAPGANAKVVMVATLPANAQISSTALNALFTATSVGDSTKVDYVWNQVAAVVAPTSRVDLTNTPAGGLTSTDGGATTAACTAGSNCDQGQGPSNNPTFTNSTTPGVTTKFPIYVSDNTGGAAVFDLSVRSLPPGWTVTFTQDATCPGTPVTSVTFTAANQGAQQQVNACVTPPIGTPAGTTNLDFVATKHDDPTVTDTLRDAVTVTNPNGNRPDMHLGPDSGNPNVNTGGTVDQPTTLTNTGTTSCGSAATGLKAKLTVTGATAGWNAVLYYDANGNGIADTADQRLTTLADAAVPNVFLITTATLQGSNPTAPSTTIPLAAGRRLPLVVKIFAPQGAPRGEIGVVNLEVSDTQTGAAACPTTTASFNATVMSGQVRVVKTQAYDATDTTCANVATTPDANFKAEGLSITPSSSASVLQCIAYKVVATNEGDAPVRNVKLSDVIPGYTNFAVGKQPAIQCSATGAGTSVVAFTPATPDVTTRALECGTVTELQPGGTLTMKFNIILQK